MKFEESGIEGLTADLNRLDDIMENEGFVRAGQWDYERVTYDRKFDMVHAEVVPAFHHIEFAVICDAFIIPLASSYEPFVFHDVV